MEKRLSRGRERSPINTDRWMISWADLLTLLFASVAVLYASAARQHANSPAPNPVSNLGAPMERLKQSLSDELRKKDVRIAIEPRGVVISLRDGAYFDSGSDRLQSTAVDTIARIAAVINDLPNDIRLEGHSDSTPIHNAQFRDNWSLSAARAATVLGVFASEFGISSQRLSITGYADNRRISSDNSPEGRALNRRVDIVIASGK